MSKTLLQLVQSILNSLDAEPVNSISDTIESTQIVGYIRNSYEEIIARIDSPLANTLIELSPSIDVTLPVVMHIPKDVVNIRWIKYDKSQPDNPIGYQDVSYQPLEDFLHRMLSENSNQSYIGTSTLRLGTGTFPLYYRTDKQPDIYTVVANNVLLFDSYNATIDSTLVSTKTMCFGEKSLEFVEDDDFVPVLSEREFVLLENEAKAQAFVEQKQTQNPTAEKRARAGWISTQREKIAAPYPYNRLASTTNYGKRGPYIAPKYLRNGS